MSMVGINAYHGDASASLVVDGQLVAAVEEERFNRIKHWAGFPSQSIQYCLDVAGIGISDVDHVAVSFDPLANVGEPLAFVASHRPTVSFCKLAVLSVDGMSDLTSGGDHADCISNLSL